ncbi:MAG TPA: hypothetical protein VFA71_02795 [Terriglobales bacterium]|nr:hypothetical protein [Terriglobales bacterium]
MKKIFMLLSAAFLMATGALAQELAPPFPPQPGFAAGNMMFFQKGPGGSGIVTANTYNYVYTTNVGEREAVKGAPYSATAVMESTQVLADGNRIVNKSSTFQARDSEGRTRREMPKGLGPLPADLPPMVMISDPVSKTDYMLNPREKTADVIKRVNGKGVFIQRSGRLGPEQAMGGETGQIKVKQNPDLGPAPFAFHVSTGGGEIMRPVEFGGDAKHESLGTQVIDGISCTGTRETRTIAAGAIGNEQPIEITFETWTSPELKTVVLSKHNDPRFGQTVYQLTDIRRNEPDQSLFQVPSDYRILSQDTVASPKE